MIKWWWWWNSVPPVISDNSQNHQFTGQQKQDLKNSCWWTKWAGFKMNIFFCRVKHPLYKYNIHFGFAFGKYFILKVIWKKINFWVAPFLIY